MIKEIVGRGIDVVARWFCVSPSYFIFSLNLVFISLSLAFNFPLVLIVLVAIGFNFALGIERQAIFSPLTLPCTLGFVSAVSHVLARMSWHGRITSRCILGVLITWSVFVLIGKRTVFRDAVLHIFCSAHHQNILPNLTIGTIVSVYWAHSLLFWNISPWNSTHAHYVQIAQMMLDRGSYRFLPPELDVPENYNFWYPNLYAHTLAIFGSGLDYQGLIRLAASLGSFMMWWGLSSAYFLVESSPKDTSLALSILLLALSSSYAFFSIGPEFTTDSAVFLFVPAVYYFLSRGLSENRAPFLYFAVATICMSLWFRVSVFLTLFAGLCLFLLVTRRLRSKLITLVGRHSLIKAGVLLFTFLLASLWQLDVFRLTGNPIHPYAIQGGHAASNSYGTSFDSTYFKGEQQEFTEPTWTQFIKLVCAEFGRKFLTLHEAPLWFVGAFSLFGAGLVMTRQKSLTAEDDLRTLSLCIIMSLLGAMLITRTYHYRFLYVLFLPALLLAVTPLSAINQKWPRIGSVFLVGMTGAFLWAYLMTGVGTERRNPNWSVLACVISAQSPCPLIKDKVYYWIAQDLKSSFRPDDRVLGFHLEPGFQVNYYLGFRPSFEEYNYQAINTSDLHCAQTNEAVVKWLHEHRARVIVSSLPSILQHYSAHATTACPELLPKMLLNRAPLFQWIDQSVAILPVNSLEAKREN